MATRLRALIFAFAGIAILATAAACSDNEADSNSTAQQSDIEATNARVQRNEMLWAMTGLGALELHDMDESISAGTVEDSFIPTARSAIRYLGLTNWSADLEDDAQALEDHAVALVAALEDDDIEAAKDPAHELHEGMHEFLETAWAEVGADLPPEAGTQPHSDEEGTPAADSTPGADETPAESH